MGEFWLFIFPALAKWLRWPFTLMVNGWSILHIMYFLVSMWQLCTSNHKCTTLILLTCKFVTWISVDDFGGWCGRRMAYDCACTMERLQSCRLCDAILPIHRGDVHFSFFQGWFSEHATMSFRELLLLVSVHLSFSFVMQRIPNYMIASKKLILRTLKLLFWGLLLQGEFLLHLHTYSEVWTSTCSGEYRFVLRFVSIELS